MSAANTLSWQSPGSSQRVSSQSSQRTIVAFQYGLLVLSGVDSAGTIYLILSPGNEVTIASASPMLTAVSTIFDLCKLLNAKILSPRQLCPSRICCSIRFSLGDTSQVAYFFIATREASCALPACIHLGRWSYFGWQRLFLDW